MLTFLYVLLAVLAGFGLVIAAFALALIGIQRAWPMRLALAVRRSRRLRRLLPDFALAFSYRLTPVGGGMGNLLVGGPNLYGGTGVPTDAALGGAPANGDIYFRVDGGANTTIYQRRAGAWVATAA